MEQVEVRYRLTGERALDGWLPESPRTWFDDLAEIGLRYSYKSGDSIELHFDFARADGPHPRNQADARQLIETKLTELGLSFEYVGVGQDKEHDHEFELLLSDTEREQLERLVAKLAS